MAKLNVVVPFKGCDRNCPFCISAANPFNPKQQKIGDRLPKVKKYMQQEHISQVILTSNGEPTLNLPSLLELAAAFQEYPLELQTNGLGMYRTPGLLNTLLAHVDVFAISVPSPSYLFNIAKPLFRVINQSGKVVRATILVSDMWADLPLKEILHKTGKAQQVVLKRLVYPADKADTPQAKWIVKHKSAEVFNYLRGEVAGFTVIIPGKPFFMDGKSVNFDYDCTRTGRSVIFHQDGHLYSEWRPESIIF